MAEETKMYGIIFVKRPGSKDLRDPTKFKPLYTTELATKEDTETFRNVRKQLIHDGYTVRYATVRVEGGLLEDDENLEVRVTKSLLKPSPEGTLGCDFEV